jgi:S-formylglutathione hydrolase FrmB
LYLLHGYTDNEVSWIQLGEVNITADKLIENREASPMIIVMPDAGLTWYINNYDGSVRYEDAFFSEFLPAIEKTYRIRASKEFRAVGGLSMGGYGSLLYAMKHPDMFVACLPFSSGIRPDSLVIKYQKMNELNLNACYGSLDGDKLSETWKENSILQLAANLPVSQLNMVNYYIDCGDKDDFVVGNSLLHFVMMDRNIVHEFRVRGGEHGWVYWRKSIEDGLKFLSPIFNR